MKSPMVTNAEYLPEEKKSGYSELRVLMSAAGYYVGTIYTNVEENGTIWEEPGSRDSDYFRTRGDAQRFLDTVEACHLDGALRQEP